MRRGAWILPWSLLDLQGQAGDVLLSLASSLSATHSSEPSLRGFCLPATFAAYHKETPNQRDLTGEREDTVGCDRNGHEMV